MLTLYTELDGFMLIIDMSNNHRKTGHDKETVPEKIII